MSTTATRRFTAEEYAALPDNGLLTELLRGVIVEMNQPTPRHSQICSRINRIAGNFIDEHDLGHVVSNDTGIFTQRNSNTVGGRDDCCGRYQKIPQGPLPSKSPTIQPDIVLAVLSPSNSRGNLQIKVGEHLRIGVAAACVRDPGNSPCPCIPTTAPTSSCTLTQCPPFREYGPDCPWQSTSCWNIRNSIFHDVC